MNLNTRYQNIVSALLRECQLFYGEGLVSFCVFGSVGRCTVNYTSDIDFLVVAEVLPVGRVDRVKEFGEVERAVQHLCYEAQKQGVYVELSPVLKTPAEVKMGSLLFLDMLDDGKILFDRDGFLKDYFDTFRVRLKELGARRVQRGESWYWILKESYHPGEVFDI